MRQNERKNTQAPRLLPKVIATGALAAILCSAAPSSYTKEGADLLASRSAVNIADSTYDTYNVNNSSIYPGVTIADGKITYALPGMVSKQIGSYTALTLNVGGRQVSVKARVMNSTVYLPLRAFATAIGATSSYDSSSRTTTLKASGLTLTATDGGYVTYANGRALFGFSPNVIMSDGRMYVPMSTLMKATGLSGERTGSSVTVSGKLSPLASADKFYSEDEVFWLARIITAEAGGESLLGQLAVGNVILNRVASRDYPNTIYGVIFDRKWGVQFSPILDGTIYNTPTYTATLAAQICLEGTKLSEDSMFFLNPITAESNWIVKNREYLYSIGGHDFYR